jgi:hypothetical protein
VHEEGLAVAKPVAARRAVLDDFVLLKTVGKGSFGKVVMVRAEERGGRKFQQWNRLRARRGGASGSLRRPARH